MIYLDTSVIVSYIDEVNPDHVRALKLVESLGPDRVVSRLTLVELVSVYSRAGLEEPIPLAIYSIRSTGARVVEVDLDAVLREAVVKAPDLRLRTLDLLHVIACGVAGCKGFATPDLDIVRRSSTISKNLGIEVLAPPP